MNYKTEEKLCDFLTNGQTDTEQSDPYVLLYVLHGTQKHI